MSSLTMVEARLPPGFRFHPRDDELVCDYLMNKWNNNNNNINESLSHHSSLLIEVDLNKCEPWDIPETVCVGGKEWYFYSQRDRKYATGLRTNRATASGYWKATGKDRPVSRKGNLVGMRKTLVFYQGRAPKGKKTNWVMHEFRLDGPFAPPKFTSSSKQEDWVLCRVFYKKEIGSKYDDHDASQHDHNEGNNSLDETSSSTLPPLMDHSYITFDHHHHQNQLNSCYNQHVPCFSITSSSSNNHDHDHNHNNHANYGNNYSSLFYQNNHNFQMIHDDDPGNGNNVDCDKKVLEVVLAQLTKMEPSIPSETLLASPNLGQITNVSQVGLPPHMWNHY
ncbi:unnamed protein product [Amaranthus hypochondriacus]